MQPVQLSGPTAKGVPHRVCIEAFTTDMDGGQKDDPPKAKCFAPELMFYQILEQYKPSRDESRDMWLKIFELWGDQSKIETYLTTKLQSFRETHNNDRK